MVHLSNIEPVKVRRNVQFARSGIERLVGRLLDGNLANVRRVINEKRGNSSIALMLLENLCSLQGLIAHFPIPWARRTEGKYHEYARNLLHLIFRLQSQRIVPV